ncbi:MAG: uroporphyrinogen-III C-methyltransferase [Gammaproteobacteria bacterium]|jgi:uroporphyrin-3 C-methyltransferase
MTTIEKEQHSIKQEKSETALVAPASGSKKLFITLIMIVTLLLSIVAIGISATNYRRLDSIERNSSNEEVFNRYDSALALLDQSISSIQSQQQDVETKIVSIVESEIRTTQSIQNLYYNQNNEDISWSLKEVEHLINIANLRISLENDVDTALIALEAADNRLSSLGEPGLYEIRRQLTVDINSLREVETVDIVGLSLYLTDLATRVNSLPLLDSTVADKIETISVSDKSLPVWKQLMHDVWLEFKGMFTITRIGNNASATLLPDEKYFIYQNLRLQLEAARLAVLRHDTAGMQESLRIINTWLTQYFDAQDSGVVNILQATERMSKLVLDPVLPVISTSLDALRNYISNRN